MNPETSVLLSVDHTYQRNLKSCVVSTNIIEIAKCNIPQLEYQKFWVSKSATYSGLPPTGDAKFPRLFNDLAATFSDYITREKQFDAMS